MVRVEVGDARSVRPEDSMICKVHGGRNPGAVNENRGGHSEKGVHSETKRVIYITPNGSEVPSRKKTNDTNFICENQIKRSIGIGKKIKFK